ncbi:MAG: hypothetical protein DHS20C15_05050 [Planctomycetota bacterium]|nr:MAG: hypothetical protein DHS20C15_05050 [Planctomycetota bacterium]
MCLLLLVAVAAAAPWLPRGGMWGAELAALTLALLGGAALLAEARAGVARPGLGTPVDKAFGAWLALSLLATLLAHPPAVAREGSLRLLTLGLAYLLAIRTLTTPARAWRAFLTALLALAIWSVHAGHGLDALIAGALGVGASLALARALRPEASDTTRRLARAAGKASLLAALGVAALLVAGALGGLGEGTREIVARSQFVAPVSALGVFELLPLIALLALIWETRRVAIRGAHLLVADAARRTLFHGLIAALVATLALACVARPLDATTPGVAVAVMLAAISRAGCDARERVASARAQLGALLVVLLLLAWALLPIAH